jgi:hypothetical protein
VEQWNNGQKGTTSHNGGYLMGRNHHLRFDQLVCSSHDKSEILHRSQERNKTPIFHYSITPLFQRRSEAEPSGHPCGLRVLGGGFLLPVFCIASHQAYRLDSQAGPFFYLDYPGQLDYKHTFNLYK